MDALVPIEAGAASAPATATATAQARTPAQTPAPASAQTTTRTPAPVPAAAPCEEEAPPTPAAPALAAAPYELLQLVTLSLDSEAKRDWRLVSKATCHTVHGSTTGLSFTSSWGFKDTTALPLPLLGKCSGLRRLLCTYATKLESIHGLPHGLEVLEINGHAITDVSPLRHCSGLRELSVCSWAENRDFYHLVHNWAHKHAAPGALYTAGGWTELRAALQCMPRLQRLELCIPPGWGMKAMQILAPALQTLTEMQYLKIAASRCEGESAIGEEGARALVSALVPWTRLQYLDLSRLGLNAADASALAPSLGLLTGLQTLLLSDNSLGPGGALALAPALTALTALQRLDLDCNAFGPDGVLSLTPSFQALSSLQVLDLSENFMGGEAAQVLAPILLTITSLRSLGLRMNHIENGVKALAPLVTVAGLNVRIGVQWEEDDYHW